MPECACRAGMRLSCPGMHLSCRYAPVMPRNAPVMRLSCRYAPVMPECACHAGMCLSCRNVPVMPLCACHAPECACHAVMRLSCRYAPVVPECACHAVMRLSCRNAPVMPECACHAVMRLSCSGSRHRSRHRSTPFPVCGAVHATASFSRRPFIIPIPRARAGGRADRDGVDRRLVQGTVHQVL
eukprot:351572-Chlamydomonas_euryale.AAC.2